VALGIGIEKTTDASARSNGTTREVQAQSQRSENLPRRKAKLSISKAINRGHQARPAGGPQAEVAMRDWNSCSWYPRCAVEGDWW